MSTTAPSTIPLASIETAGPDGGAKMTEALAMAVVKSIALGKVPHITIRY